MDTNTLDELNDVEKTVGHCKEENVEKSSNEVEKMSCFAFLKSLKVEPTMFGMFLASALSGIYYFVNTQLSTNMLN